MNTKNIPDTADETQNPQRFRGEWEMKRVSEFGDVITGATPSTQIDAFWDGSHPWITPTDITSERDMTVSERTITQEGLNAIRTLRPNTVLVTCIASIGKNAILRATGGCNQQINAVTPNGAHDVEFLYYLFEFNSNYLLANAGITATNIVSKSTFSNLVFEVPPLPEQRAIASVLSDVDGLLNALDALIAKKRAMKQAVMQQLLTGKTRLPGFSGTWMEKLLSDLAVITMGQSPSSTFYNLRGEGLPLIQGNADIENRHTIERVWSTQGNKRCNLGDLILTVRAPVGAVAVASKNAFIGRGVCSLKPVGDSRFLLHALVHAESRWQTLEQGSTFTAANSEQVGQFHLHVPDSVEEQHAIASVLSDMDAEITALEQRRDKTRAIKQGMMQQLLTGRVRLSESRICADDTD